MARTGDMSSILSKAIDSNVELDGVLNTINLESVQYLKLARCNSADGARWCNLRSLGSKDTKSSSGEPFMVYTGRRITDASNPTSIVHYST